MTDPTHLHSLTPIGPGRGAAAIANRTFIKVRFEDSAVIPPIGGTAFQNCNMGDPGGDIRNMPFIPARPQKVAGTTPFVNCTFQDCAFLAVGVTGSADFPRQFQDMVAGARA